MFCFVLGLKATDWIDEAIDSSPRDTFYIFSTPIGIESNGMIEWFGLID